MLINGGLPGGYVCEQTAEEWTSVFEEKGGFEWNKLQRLGEKRLLPIWITEIRVFVKDTNDGQRS